MRGLGLAIDHRRGHLVEACLTEKALQLDFGKPEPDVSIKFASLLEVVFKQIKHHNAAAGAQDPRGFGGRHGRA